ncbi:hypothetical protein SAMN05216178_6854 [Pseudomonas saponiphila]|jgi:hypothetical protein|uniref:Uncharacterized protein n=1 Tax=Pseudomonas saponiphila TaxID=556534 RepID=A0A1H4ZVF2_9PSED|nr:hypothetical protein [Pseudomonas saponiphila]SED34079.1 hypothetical protein SAMN05216178_6854 [Pseudomonas saponiphila]
MDINLQELRLKAETAVAAYLDAAGEPASISLRNGFSIEIDHNESTPHELSVVVAKEHSGYVRSRFVGDEVKAAIYCEDETVLDPVQEISALSDDLRGDV